MGHHAANSIRMSQPLCGFVDITNSDQLANSAAGDEGIAVDKRLDDFELHVLLFAKASQGFDVAFSAATKEKVWPFDHGFGTDLIDDDLLKELLIGQPQQFPVGWVSDDGIDTKLRKQVGFAIGPGEGRGCLFGPENADGMRIESKNNRGRV